MDRVRGRVYLCGPITGESLDNAKRGWRRLAETALNSHNIECLNPLRHVQKVSSSALHNMPPMGLEQDPLSTSKGLTRRDKFDLSRSDLVLCNLQNTSIVSVGSMIELGWADALGIPVVLCVDSPNVHKHAMVDEICSWHYDNLPDALQAVCHLLCTD